MTVELENAAETKQQMELDYNNKCEAYETLSAEFLDVAVSFDVCCRLNII